MSTRIKSNNDITKCKVQDIPNCGWVTIIFRNPRLAEDLNLEFRGDVIENDRVLYCAGNETARHRRRN